MPFEAAKRSRSSLDLIALLLGPKVDLLGKLLYNYHIDLYRVLHAT